MKCITACFGAPKSTQKGPLNGTAPSTNSIPNKSPPPVSESKAKIESVNLVTRSLEEGDYHKGFLQILSQLTQVGDYAEGKFKERFAQQQALPGIYKVVVIEDLDKKKIIATATLLIELKFIRNCGKCGHIEDVVVDTSYRGQRLGLRVIEALIDAAKEAGCYKVILDCTEENSTFYAKCGLTKKEIQMVRYL